MLPHQRFNHPGEHVIRLGQLVAPEWLHLKYQQLPAGKLIEDVDDHTFQTAYMKQNTRLDSSIMNARRLPSPSSSPSPSSQHMHPSSLQHTQPSSFYTDIHTFTNMDQRDRFPTPIQDSSFKMNTRMNNNYNRTPYNNNPPIDSNSPQYPSNDDDRMDLDNNNTINNNYSNDGNNNRNYPFIPAGHSNQTYTQDNANIYRNNQSTPYSSSPTNRFSSHHYTTTSKNTTSAPPFDPSSMKFIDKIEQFISPQGKIMGSMYAPGTPVDHQHDSYRTYASSTSQSSQQSQQPQASQQPSKSSQPSAHPYPSYAFTYPFPNYQTSPAYNIPPQPGYPPSNYKPQVPNHTYKILYEGEKNGVYYYLPDGTKRYLSESAVKKARLGLLPNASPIHKTQDPATRQLFNNLEKDQRVRLDWSRAPQ